MYYLLTIIPQARMGSETIGHAAEGSSGGGDQLVGEKFRDKTTLAS